MLKSTEIGSFIVSYRMHEGSVFFATVQYSLAMYVKKLAEKRTFLTQFDYIKYESIQTHEDYTPKKSWNHFDGFAAKIQMYPSYNLLACYSMHDARVFRGLTMMQIAHLALQSVTQCTELLWQTAEKRKYNGEWDKVKEFEQNLRAVDDQKLAQIVETELIRYMNLGGDGAEESRDMLKAFRKELKRN